MKIRFYGTRGSIPVASEETRKYGGNTTCLYVESNQGDTIIIDAGSGIRGLNAHCIEKKIRDLTLVFTHYHWDHIQGIPFFTPVYMKSTNLNIYGPDKEAKPQEALMHQMMRPYFPTVTWNDMVSRSNYLKVKKELDVGSITIETIPTNHPNYTLGLKFREGKKCFVFLTDNELFAKDGATPYRKFVDFVKDADFVIHDAAYAEAVYQTRIGWGHSTYEQVMQLSSDSGVGHVIFTHHDPPTTDKTIDKILAALRGEYPKRTIEAASDGKTIDL